MNASINKYLLPKIYIAAKFNKNKLENGKLSLKNDFRVDLIGDENKFINFNNQSFIIDKNNKPKYQYVGPFYCEQASNGDFTSTDCNVVLDSEYKAISNCDVYCAVFDENFSVGTIVELSWAINMNKDIIILYKEEESEYEIKSEYWFAILDALKRSNKVKIFSFNEQKEVIEKIRE